MKYFIHPEIAARKFEAAAKGEAPKFAAALAAQPRCRELVWALQGRSFQEGIGLAGFAANLIARFPQEFGTATMIARADKETYAEYERDAILGEIGAAGNLRGLPEAQDDWLYDRLWRFARPDRKETFFGYEHIPNDAGRKHAKTLDRAALRKICADFAAEFLAEELFRVCTAPDACFEKLWYCPNLPALLIQALDAEATEAQNAIAKTAISTVTFEALDRAFVQRSFIRIDGSSRFGKTESVRAWCNGRPGAARLVATHCMGADIDFFLSIADAFGFPRDYKITQRVLRMKIEFVTHYACLMFVFDEAHFLVPENAYRSARPTRLNWVRTWLVDRRNPVALVTTPQVFNSAVKRFRDVSSFDFEHQWEGRITRTVPLADKLSPQDLLAVVKHKAPHFPLEFQEDIADHAILTVNYLTAVQSIVDASMWLASLRGRKQPTRAELDQAIAEAVRYSTPKRITNRISRNLGCLPHKAKYMSRPGHAREMSPASETQPV